MTTSPCRKSTSLVRDKVCPQVGSDHNWSHIEVPNFLQDLQNLFMVESLSQWQWPIKLFAGKVRRQSQQGLFNKSLQPPIDRRRFLARLLCLPAKQDHCWHVYNYVFIYLFFYVFMYLFLCIYLHACVYIQIYDTNIYIYIHISIHIYIYT